MTTGKTKQNAEKYAADFDVAIIGAGIQGAAVAQAASAAGYRVLVLEQFDQAAVGTSSRSSKLIHGGLRYLETGQFGLVKECLIERALLIKNAPNLVRLVPFHIPIYKNTSRSRWTIMAGLLFYSLFSRKPFKRIAKKNWQHLDGLKTENLKAVFQYYDAQTDDAKLTRAVLASAESMQTEIQYKAYFKQAQIQESGCEIEYEQAGQTKKINARCLINASGPWVDKVVEKITPTIASPEIELIQGAHIEIPGKVDQGMYYCEAPQDKRAVFVMPWKGHLLVGTTESAYQGDPAKVQALDSEIEYLLKVYNHYFQQNLKPSDVLHSFAGLRVLPKAMPKATGKAFSRPRDTVMICDDEKAPKVVSLYGGKLTAHRATADEVLTLLKNVLPARKAIADTRNLPLPEIA